MKIFKKVVVTLLIIILCCVIMLRDYYFGPYDSWCSDGLGRIIPKLEKVIRDDGSILDISFSNRGTFVATITGASEDQFNQYVNALIETGYEKKMNRSEHYFSSEYRHSLRHRSISVHYFPKNKDEDSYMSIWLS